jgi:regulator of replication initiation timing
LTSPGADDVPGHDPASLATAIVGVASGGAALFLSLRKDARDARRVAKTATSADRKTDLEEFRLYSETITEDNHRLRVENYRYRSDLAELRNQVEDLHLRVNSLAAANADQAAHVERCEAENESLRSRVVELERTR